MNRALLNPFESSVLPRTIKDYLEGDEKAVVMQFNRHGNLLAAALASGRIIVWDFDTKTIATIIRSYPIDGFNTSNNKRAKIVSLTFLAPGNGSAIVLAYDSGLIRVFHTLTGKLLCQVWISGLSSLHQVEAHPKIETLLIAVPSDSLPILLHLRRGSYHLPLKNLRRVTDPSVLIPVPSAPLFMKPKDDPEIKIIDGNHFDHDPNIDDDDFDFYSTPPPPPKTAFGNTCISSLPPASSNMVASLLCSTDDFHRPRRRRNPQQQHHPSRQKSKSKPTRRPRPSSSNPTTNNHSHSNSSELNDNEQQRHNAIETETISSNSSNDVNFVNGNNNSDSDSDFEEIAHPVELNFANFSGNTSNGTGNSVMNGNMNGSSSNGLGNSNSLPINGGSGQKKRALFCVAFSRHPRRILRAGPTGLLRIFALQRAPDTDPFVQTAVSLYTVVLHNRVAARSLTVSRRDKLLVNSHDRCLRLYDLHDLDKAAGSPSPSNSRTSSPNRNERRSSANPGATNSSSININDEDDDVVMVDDGQLSNKSNRPSQVQIPGNPKATFSEIVNRAQCRCAVFSLDGDFVVGGVDGTQHRIHIWRVHDGQIDVTLEGPNEGILQLLIHPLRPVIVSLGAINGGVYIWDKEISENWSAFSTQFSELEANEEYHEREDEFDLVDEESEKIVERRQQEEAADVDITGPFRPGWFDSDSEPESFFYLPAAPFPDSQDETPSLVDNIISRRQGELSLRRTAPLKEKKPTANGYAKGGKTSSKDKRPNEKNANKSNKAKLKGRTDENNEGGSERNQNRGSIIEIVDDLEDPSEEGSSSDDSGSGSDSESESESDSSSESGSDDEDDDDDSSSGSEDEIQCAKSKGRHSRFGAKGPVTQPPLKRPRASSAMGSSSKDRDVSSASSAVVVVDENDDDDSSRRGQSTSRGKGKPSGKTVSKPKANSKAKSSRPPNSAATRSKQNHGNDDDAIDVDVNMVDAEVDVVEEEQVLDEGKG